MTTTLLQPISRDVWLTPAETAGILRIERQTLSKWRMDGRGPKYHRLNSRVLRYKLADVEAFLQQSSSSSGQ